MKILKFNESIINNKKPKKGEFIIYEYLSDKKLHLVEIISPRYASGRYSNSIYVYTEELDNNEGDIYYNIQKKFFYYSNGVICNIKWRGFNKEEAINAFEILKDTEKYNL